MTPCVIISVKKQKYSNACVSSLESHTLSQKLSWLLSDREHLLSCFEKYAYLCQEKYGEATLICLRAVEQNAPSLLIEIDPCLVCIFIVISRILCSHDCVYVLVYNISCFLCGDITV